MEKDRLNVRNPWREVIFGSLWRIFIVTTLTEIVLGVLFDPSAELSLAQYFEIFVLRPVILQLLLLGILQAVLYFGPERIGHDAMSLISIGVANAFACSIIFTHPSVDSAAFTLILPILVTVVYRKKIYLYIQVIITILLYALDRRFIANHTSVLETGTVVTDVIVFVALVIGFALVEEQVRRATLKLDLQGCKDSLTNLYNHETFYEYLERHMGMYRENGEAFSMIIADIDDFKLVNDTYGHIYGDAVIRAVTESLQRNCGENDVIARYGGEEFAVLLPGKTKSEAILLADRIRRDFEVVELETVDGPQSFTISIGVAEYDREYPTSSTFFEQADMALYKAKRDGKNKVCCS